jgi:hypothetical protein
LSPFSTPLQGLLRSFLTELTVTQLCVTATPEDPAWALMI